MKAAFAGKSSVREIPARERWALRGKIAKGDSALAKLETEGTDVSKWTLPQLVNHLIETTGTKVAVQYVHDNWLDVDDIGDLSDLYKF